MAKLNRWMSNMSEGPKWSRLFVQSEEYVHHPFIARARWVELEMTDEFLDRIQHLTDLLARENLLSIDILMPLSWNVDPHWEINGDTKVSVSEGILQFVATVRPRNWPPALAARMKSDHVSTLEDAVHAMFIFGSINELLGHFSSAEMAIVDNSLSGFDPSKIESSVGFQMLESVELQFTRAVNAYLIEKGLRPLRR